MTTSQESKLNFYSKYNRVRDKQDIESLYALIDDTDHYISHFQQMIFTLNCSRASDSDEGSPIRQFHTEKKTKRSKDGNVLGVFQEEEKDVKFKEMEEKLKKLERLEKNFHEQLDKSQREYRRKKELKEAKRKEREYYRNQLINVIEHTSEQSQQSKVSQNDDLLPYGENITSQVFQNPLPEDEDDYYSQAAEVKINDKECEYDVKETKRKLKEILEMQRKREREVESVQENNDGKASSIVIERLNIMPKTMERNDGFQQGFGQEEIGKEKEGKNYCEVELSHSQSQNVLRNVRSFDKLGVKDQATEVQEQNYENQRTNTPYEQQHNAYTNTEQHFEPESMHYSNPNLPYNHHQNYQHQHVHYQQQQEYGRQRQIEQEQHESELYEVQEAVEEEHHQPHAHNYNYSEHDHIDPPLTLAQQSGNNHFTVQDASQLNEEIADRVISIQGHSEQQSQPAHNNVNNRSPLFLSQTNPRKTFQNQYQVQSIAQSLDFHPLQNQSPERRQSKSEIVYGDKELKNRNEANDNPGDKKTSFKKLMAENRANLIPRLAISTILNQHINQALGDYRTNTPTPAPAPIPIILNLHESIISNSQGNSSFAKPGKVNFKSLLQKSKKNTSRDKVVVPPKDPVKQQVNKKLLMSFFDQN